STLFPYTTLFRSDLTIARDRFYYQFFISVSTWRRDRRSAALEPDQAAIEILATRYHRGGGGERDEPSQHLRTEKFWFVQCRQGHGEGEQLERRAPFSDPTRFHLQPFDNQKIDNRVT